MMPELRLLALSAATGRAGYVFLIGVELTAWGVSRKAARSPENAAESVQSWINEFKPTVVVTEKIESAARKGDGAKEVIRAFANTAAHNRVFDISVAREQRYPNKYDEAEALAALYSEIAPWVPKRHQPFDGEPRSTVIFEALALAHKVLESPTLTLASEMDRK